MIYKHYQNSQLEELEKSTTDRRYNLSELSALIINNVKKCIWCLKELPKSRKKYCSDECGENAFTWANPQSVHGMGTLLIKQNFKCNICGYDYRPFIEQSLKRRIHDITDWISKNQMLTPLTDNLNKLREMEQNLSSHFDWSVYTSMKTRVPSQFNPEVDHIIPIYKGGPSIGLSNHQVICYTCHKKKTKEDMKRE
jgi:5-methylcytosine-specific restriction endonuclease McrA